MFKNRNIVRGILLAVLLLCTAYLVYSIIVNPLGEHDIILAGCYNGIYCIRAG